MFRNRWVRRTIRGLLVLIALLILGFFGDRYVTRRAGEKRYAEIVAHLDATDPRWRYEEIDADRGQLPDAENGALLISRFTAALATPRFDADPLLGSDNQSLTPPNHDLDDPTYDAIDRALASNAQALAIALTFNEYPKGLRRYTLPPVTIDVRLPEAQQTRYVFRLLDLAAERAARDGRGGTALRQIRPMVNAGRSLDGEPFMIVALVRMACDRAIVTRVERTLGLSMPREQLPAIQSLLQCEADSDLFWYSLRGDRAVMDQLFRNLQTGDISFNDLANVGAGSSTPQSAGLETKFATWRYAPYLASDHAAFLEVVTAGYDARHLPEHQQRAQMNRVERVIRAMPPREFGTLITRNTTPSFRLIHDGSLRIKALLRTAVVGVAVERFRLAHGRWPASLAELPKDILPAIPLDPFDGQPLRYVKRADGVTVYSIGLDETDDGGKIRVGKTTSDPGQDIGFRLYDPAHRGLPAVPTTIPSSVIRIGPNGEREFAEGPRVELGPEPREIELD